MECPISIPVVFLAALASAIMHAVWNAAAHRRPDPGQGLAVVLYAASLAAVPLLMITGLPARVVCLPLIRPIGSRRSPEVFVMEPTHAGHLHHPALARRLHTPWLGGVLGQR